VRKDHSFVLPSNVRKQDTIQLTPTPSSVLRETWTDRSQRILKTRAMNNDASIKRMDEMAKLRQTVSNVTSWQFRTPPSPNPMPPSSTALEDPKKAELDYLEVKKEFKSKFASKQHSRNNSRTEDTYILTGHSLIDPPPLAKTPTKTTITPRVSQDKLTVGKDRSMSKTDPLGNFASLALTRKTTSCRPADLRI
jgi:hypothetical protein